jgi:hypothetical protein
LDVQLDVCVVGADVSDPDGQWAKPTGLSPETAPLVRPADFVGRRADTLPGSPDAELGAAPEAS